MEIGGTIVATMGAPAAEDIRPSIHFTSLFIGAALFMSDQYP